MAWMDDAVRASTRAELEEAWRQAVAAGTWRPTDQPWMAALARRLADVDVVAMNELTKQLGAKEDVA